MSKPIGPDRHFLGWDRPLLPQVVQWLVDMYPPAGGPLPAESLFPESQWDLQHVTLVLPGRRALRRLKELLDQYVAEHDLQFNAPRLITIGGLADSTIKPSQPVATELEQTLAWCQVLRETDPAQLLPLLATPPPSTPIAPWLELAGALRRLHEQLASENYTFDLIADFFDYELPRESPRWRLLADLCQRYFSVLNRANRCDPFAERRAAIAERRCEAPGNVVVIGAVDLNKSLRALLDAISPQVSILIAAPEAEQSAFDRWGCVDPAAWMDRNLDIDPSQILPAGDAEDQAILASEQRATWSEALAIDQITIGVTDEAMIAPISQHFAIDGVQVRTELGTPLLRSAPARLIRVVVDYVQTRSFRDFSTLVRHADVCRMINRELIEHPDWLMQLDQLRSENFPARTTGAIADSWEHHESITRLVAVVDQWLDPLLAWGSSGEAAITQWVDAVQRILGHVYSPQTGNDASWASENPVWQQQIDDALGSIDRVLARLAGVSLDLELTLPAATIAEMLLAQLAEQRQHDAQSPDKIELVGWLDLALDDKPAMCVVGLNEPFVPEAIVADPFLPGSVRHKLKIADNEQRFARDCYALNVILRCRAQASLIVGRWSVGGSPTPPSRLLATCDAQVAAHRTVRLLGQLPTRQIPESIWTTDREASELPIPAITTYVPPTILSVTAFGDYLRCPYRFYLRHIARLKPCDDSAVELAANQFGNLVHDTLEEFGKTGPKHSTNVLDVQACLLDVASDLAKQRYGQTPVAAVRLQITSALDRLKLVAQRQVERTQQGWLLWAAEKKVDVAERAHLMVDGQPFGLKGRIDRIDFHEGDQRWAVIDYKTHGHPPMKKHYKKATNQWIDLQLPLYRHMLSALGIDTDPFGVQLGYFNIGEKPADVNVNIAPLTPELFASADQAAAEVVRGVRQGRFEPNPDAATSYDDYAVICQTAIIEQWFLDSPEEVSEELEA